MAAVRVLFCLLCLAFAGRCGVFSSGIIGYGRSVERRTAVVAGTKDRKVLHDAGAVVRAAQKEIGVRETGENTGAKVDEYNAYVGLHKVAWCAAFVSWCHGQAGYKEPRTAWSPALFPAGKLAKGQVKYTPSRLGNSGFAETARGLSGDTELAARTELGAGLVLGIYYPDKGRIAHCGIVERLQGDFVVSIEGNTNVSGSREGDGVYRKIRHRRTVRAYADWCQIQ